MEEWRKIKTILYGLMIFAILASIFGVIFISYTNSQTQIITIQDKYVKEGIYYIADTNGNTYIVEDLIFLGKWNRSDLYNGIDPYIYDYIRFWRICCNCKRMDY